MFTSRKFARLLPDRPRTKVPLVRPELVQFEEIADDVSEILRSGVLSNFGPYCAGLEQSVAEFVGTRFAIAVANGATGLVFVLNTLPRGSEVIVPSFTFAPTVQALLWNGLIPVFADIDSGTLCLTADAVRPLVTPRTSAILAVHMFGTPAPVEELTEIAGTFNLALYFDAAHALGAAHKGQRIGSFGNAEVFSLSATKLLPCGEGGMITTNDELLDRRLRSARNYGLCEDAEDCRQMGLNGKLPEFNALLGLRGLPNLDRVMRRREQIASEYRRRLSTFPFVRFQSASPEDSPAPKDFVVILQDAPLTRDQLMKALQEEGIETAPYFSPPVHQMTIGHPYAQRPLPNTDLISSSILSIPFYSSLSDDEVDYICSAIERLLT